MNTPTLDMFVAVPLPTDLYAEFARRFPNGVSTVLEELARNFLDRTADDLDDFSDRLPQGVYWEALLLPDGTEVRTKYFGEYKLAKIDKAQITWEGKVYRSMSQLARKMRGNTSNNAWKVLEIKRPTDPTWKIADYLRR